MAPNRKSTEKGSLAATASEQIRAIIEAAEQTAVQIRAAAEEEAGRIRQQAKDEAGAIQSQARKDVHVLIESIRTGLSRLRADLELLEGKLTQPTADPGDEAAVALADVAVVPADEADGDDDATRAATSSGPAAQPVSAGGQRDADAEGARLVALNMALDGASRDEVDRYLDENFELTDREALLDEVYASVSG